jgi:glyoxylase-like metal-dependent hydrolase (beta-lactamase superfamily II)
MIQIKTFVFNPFQENTYVVYDHTRECIILDPGCYFDEEKDKLTHFITENNLKPKYIVHTHGHIDHAIGTNFLKEEYGIQAVMHSDDLELLRRNSEFGASIGIEVDQPSDPEIFISENEEISFGDTQFKVLHAPGHSPGSIVLHNPGEKLLFSGDVLFRRGIGRSDLMGGDHITLIESIQNKLLVLDEDTKVYAGHGEPTTIGEEKRENPLLI